jgi:hypothetical protein
MAAYGADFRIGAALVALLSIMVVTACQDNPSPDYTSTLYRNSPLDHSMRIHWATFNEAENGGTYNRDNCEMAARLLNANVDASAEREGKPRDPAAGFWCEPGKYNEKGIVPSSFPSQFPTDV